MNIMKKLEEEAEQAGKEAYGGVDMVNSPIDAIAAALGDGFEFYLQGNIMKYLWRYRYKNGTEDLKKARWYLDRLITEVEGYYDDKS
jgi:hypothetical protein